MLLVETTIIWTGQTNKYPFAHKNRTCLGWNSDFSKQFIAPTWDKIPNSTKANRLKINLKNRYFKKSLWVLLQKLKQEWMLIWDNKRIIFNWTKGYWSESVKRFENRPSSYIRDLDHTIFRVCFRCFHWNKIIFIW